jgi:hypothetical protein
MSTDTKVVVDYLKRNVLISVCGGLVLIMLVVLYPRLDEPSRLEAALAERTAVLKKLKVNIANSAQLEEHVRELAAVNQGIASNALRVGDLAQNLKLFYELEAKTGVKLIDVRPIGVPPAPKGSVAGSYVPIPFAVTIEGDYQQLLNFVKNLEGGRELCRLNLANISAGEDDLQRLSISIEVLGVRI